ncbi:hypothetical protein KQH65_02010 [archaeon]|nr:hypothetical protein [archaeon]
MFHKQSKEIILLGLALFVISGLGFSPNAHGSTGLNWLKTRDGKGSEIIHASILTSDNYIVVVGETLLKNERCTDVYIAKLDITGKLLWNTTFSDTRINQDDAAYSVIETSNGYVVTGKISDVDTIGDDVLLLKVNKAGKKMWYRNYGGNAWDWGNDLVVTQDEKIIVAGTTQDFYVSVFDVYLVKCNTNGILLWKRKISNIDNQYTKSIVKTSDNEYLITGNTSNSTNTNPDIFLLKTDSSGREIWYKEYGGSGRDFVSKIIEYGENFLLVGKTDSYGAGQYDIYVLNIDSEGNVIWETTVGSPYDDSGENICYTSGDIIITGNTFKNQDNNQDLYFVKIDQFGNLSFNQTYGIYKYEKAVNILPIESDTYISSGYGGNPTNYNIYLRKITFKKRYLEINTSIGVSYGAGYYFNGSEIMFGIENEIIMETPLIRYVFTGWNSSSVGGYIGDDNPVNLTIMNDIIQTAYWQKQCYVEINCPSGSNTTINSGWYEYGEELKIEFSLKEGYNFDHWVGTGNGSYSGEDNSAYISVLGPITQTIVLEKIPVFSLEINSPYGGPMGSGEYYDGELVMFNITKKIVYIDKGIRCVFQGWKSPSETGITGEDQTYYVTMTENIIENAEWKKQYYVNITSNIDALVLSESGWYDEGSDLLLTCTPQEGYNFVEWEGEGDSTYVGNKDTVTIQVTSPICERAFLTDAEPCSLTIQSKYGDFSETSTHYIGENVSISISPEIIYLSNTSRMGFQEWKSNNDGYKGNENPAYFIIKEDTIQEAVWIKQYYVKSDDLAFNQWFDENASITLNRVEPSFLISKYKEYSDKTTSLEGTVLVTSPLNLVTKSQNIYLNASLLFVFPSIAVFVLVSRYRSKFIKKPEFIQRIIKSVLDKIIDRCQR